MFSRSSILLVSVTTVAYLWLNYVKKGPVYQTDKSLKGKTVLITGGNVGIGKATALEFAKRGAKVIIASRNVPKSTLVQLEIITKTKNSNIKVYELDLSNFENVRAFAKSFDENEEYLDILINNAGTVDAAGVLPSGLNRIYAVNHFGHFLLTNLLLEKMKKQSTSRPVKIINLSSGVYKIGSYSDEFLFENTTTLFGFFKMYASSKLANIYFTSELHELLKGYNISTYSINPGPISTELGMNYPGLIRYFVKWIFHPLFLRDPYYGVQTTLYCVFDEEAAKYSGDYFDHCARYELYNHAKNKTLQKHLWKKSLEITGLKQK